MAVRSLRLLNQSSTQSNLTAKRRFFNSYGKGDETMELTEGTDILEKSKEIRNKLLVVQNKIEKQSHQIEMRMLSDIRHEYGYNESTYSHGNGLIDTRVASKLTVISPKLLSTVLPVSEKSAITTRVARDKITDILNHKENRMLVIVGPCSIHDANAAYEYAEVVKGWRTRFDSVLEVVMRTYIEKPRTELGWKGFVYDPLLNETDDINLGLVASRMLACKITDLGVPIAVERLNALTPQYLNSLVAYDVIGARNTTDQKAREYASATSSPVGFKNTPEGSIEFAAQAAVSASGKHAFLGIDSYGATKQINSLGNSTGHIILRGGSTGPNYTEDYIESAKLLLSKKGLTESVIIDASHGNSAKIAANQIKAINSVNTQLQNGEIAIRGVMIESNLVSGCQKVDLLKNLVYGQSITDDCVGIEETERMLALLANASQKRIKNADNVLQITVA
jgi:3-deoxy-7-phosphoheptulonate synthase